MEQKATQRQNIPIGAWNAQTTIYCFGEALCADVCRTIATTRNAKPDAAEEERRQYLWWVPLSTTEDKIMLNVSRSSQ